MQRYWQQILVPEFGPQGQQKLQQAKVLIAGAGGLGTPVATYLTAAGVGTIGIADGDTIAISNLHRQFLFTEAEAGQSKAVVLTTKLKAQNPTVQVNIHAEMLNETNATGIIHQYDIICDCTDDADTRILIDRTCGALQKPLVYAVVRDWTGYITLLYHRKHIALEEVFSLKELKDIATSNCSVAGIINTTCAIAAGIQASETIKLISGLPSKLDGGILCFDARGPVFRILRLNNTVK
jgi:molybdopterin/thiamine biosynthesis adenylyltransferase